MEIKVVEDSDGQLAMVFPPELLNQMGWDVGDQLEFDFEDDKVYMKKVENES